MTGDTKGPSPKDIRQVDASTLGISWTDGHESVYPVRLLRLKCPCANCIDEWTGEKRLDPESVSEDIRPLKLNAVGLYALQFDWSDGHSTGIYPYDMLRKFCACKDCQPS